MYTSYIGSKFIELYNEKMNSDYTPESFFDEQFFPLFFNDERHLMHVHGSSFFQKVSKKDLIGGKTKHQFRLERLKKSIDEGRLSGSTYVGYAAETEDAVTSGQMTNLFNLEIDKDEIYASWIGQALSIGVNGGLFLLDNSRIIWQLFEGWKFYRKFLNQTPNVKDKQIETWNGNWLIHCLGKNFDILVPELGLNIETVDIQGKIAIPTALWSEIFYRLSVVFPSDEFIVNSYVMSKTNSTLGFIKVFLHEVNKPLQFKEKLIDLGKYETSSKSKDIQKFETFFNFKNACQFGTIGLEAMEPKGLRQFMPRGSKLWAEGKDLNFNKEESYYLYEIYQIWIMATLNKTQLLELASKTASILHGMEASHHDRGKKVYSQKSKEIRESKHLKAFIQNISEIVLDVKEEADTLKKVVEEVLQMPTDNFPLFITLIRFEYNYLDAKN